MPVQDAIMDGNGGGGSLLELKKTPGVTRYLKTPGSAFRPFIGRLHVRGEWGTREDGVEEADFHVSVR